MNQHTKTQLADVAIATVTTTMGLLILAVTVIGHALDPRRR